jgi:sugar phosphate isomerase/epimerase
VPRTVPRRRFFVDASAAIAALGLGVSRVAAQQALERRQPMGLRLSCSSLAFSDRSWEEALVEIKRLGFRFADLAMFEGWTHVFPSALADPEGQGKKIAEACAKLDVEPIAIHANFAIGDRKQFPGLTIADPAARKTILAHFERVVACARTAEVPLINLQPGKFIEGVPRETCLKNAIDMLTQMHAMAARRGIMLSFENHSGSIAEAPQDALAILDGVAGLRLDYDVSHVVASSISLEETRPLLKFISHVGVRNARPGDFNLPVTDGKLHFAIAPFLEALRQAKVNAYVSVEYFQPELRPSIAPLKAILEGEGVTG